MQPNPARRSARAAETLPNGVMDVRLKDCCTLVPVVCVGARPTGYMWALALFFALVYVTTPLFYVSRAERASIGAAVLAWKRG